MIEGLILVVLFLILLYLLPRAVWKFLGELLLFLFVVYLLKDVLKAFPASQTHDVGLGCGGASRSGGNSCAALNYRRGSVRLQKIGAQQRGAKRPTADAAAYRASMVASGWASLYVHT